MKILDRFSVLLLDMNGTFMFGEDRFGADEDFYRTYRHLGGTKLSPDEVHIGIRNCHDGMLRLYQAPENFDDFPSLAEGLRRYSDAPETELSLLEQVFSLHECGKIPQPLAALLLRLSQTHQLGVVSNIWGDKKLWLSEFDRAGISNVFTCKIFSSDSRSIKPSQLLFRHALQSFPEVSRILFIGDSLDRDIKPAKALGMATAWINPGGNKSPHSDYILNRLMDIETGTPGD